MSAPRRPLPQHRFVCLPPPNVTSERRTAALREVVHALLSLREPAALQRCAAAARPDVPPDASQRMRAPIGEG
jgi:hypothetical protein